VKDTKIGWTDHTFNPWWGCEKVSPACKRCYAETFSRRLGESVWGENAPRKFFGDGHWTEPLKWDRAAAREGRRSRVFCASMADVLEDRADLDPWRAKLWRVIEATPHLDWLLLTKRPERFSIVPSEIMRRVWAGTTVESQDYVGRISHLPPGARVRFVSAEPLLGPIDLREVLARVDWLIVGGESGPGFREMSLGAARTLVEQARREGVAAYVKQDSGLYAGRQGRISAEWCWKEWPAPRDRGDARQPSVPPKGGDDR
jgi:protein gp37